MATHSSFLAWRISWTEEPGDYSPWDHKESDKTEWLLLFFSPELYTYQVAYSSSFYLTIRDHLILSGVLHSCGWNISHILSSYMKIKVKWPVIRNLQWTIESNQWSWSSYKYTRSCRRTQCRPFYGRSAFEVSWRGEKAQ